MTHLTGTALAVAVPSLAVLMFFRTATPDLPIKPEETELVVGACAVAVVSARWIMRRWRRQGVSA